MRPSSRTGFRRTLEGQDHLPVLYWTHCGHADLLRECVDGRTGQ